MLVTDNIPDITEKIGGYYGTMEGIFEVNYLDMPCTIDLS